MYVHVKLVKESFLKGESRDSPGFSWIDPGESRDSPGFSVG
jgi:hypothetical protein